MPPLIRYVEMEELEAQRLRAQAMLEEGMNRGFRSPPPPPPPPPAPSGPPAPSKRALAKLADELSKESAQKKKRKVTNSRRSLDCP